MTPPHTLVVTDLDGTFWGNRVQCHEDTIAAHAQLAERGAAFLVATGRRASSAKAGLAANGLTVPCVLLNGALGIDFTTEPMVDAEDSLKIGGRRFHEAGFAPEDIDTLVSVFARHDLRPCVYLADGRVVLPDGASTTATHRDSLLSFDGEVLHEELAGVGQRYSTLYASILGAEPAALEPCLNDLALAPCETAAYGDHMYGGLSVMAQPPGISKWIGIQAYIDYAGIAPQRIVALGDGGNDVQMLEHADLAIAVSGGDPQALDLADEVIPPPDKGGWAKVLDLL